jgi:hypothetical protein
VLGGTQMDRPCILPKICIVLKTEFAVCKRIEFTGTFVISLLGTITLIIVCYYCSKWSLCQLYLF